LGKRRAAAPRAPCPQVCTHAEYDRINELKLPRCSIRSQVRGGPTRHRKASVAGPQSFSEFWDHEIVPLNCPTCQGFGPNRRLRRASGYFAWGCFRHFCWEPRRPGATASSIDVEDMLRVVVSNFRASPTGVLRNKVPAFAKIAPIYSYKC
jgi:hypothetical protein